MQNAREAMQQADDWLGVPQVRCMIDLCQSQSALWFLSVSDGVGLISPGKTTRKAGGFLLLVLFFSSGKLAKSLIILAKGR